MKKDERIVDALSMAKEAMHSANLAVSAADGLVARSPTTDELRWLPPVVSALAGIARAVVSLSIATMDASGHLYEDQPAPWDRPEDD